MPRECDSCGDTKSRAKFRKGSTTCKICAIRNKEISSKFDEMEKKLMDKLETMSNSISAIEKRLDNVDEKIDRKDAIQRIVMANWNKTF